jgi:hypothetical protein
MHKLFCTDCHLCDYRNLGLLCRYWVRVLLAEGIVKGDHPCFTSWFDLDGEKCIFSEYQVDNWEQPHLKACHRYLETPIERTPSTSS